MTDRESVSSDVLRSLLEGLAGVRLGGPAEAAADLLLLQFGEERRDCVRVLHSHGQIAITDAGGSAISLDPTVAIAGERFLSDMRALATDVFRSLCVRCGIPHHDRPSSSIKRLRLRLQHVVLRARLSANRDGEELTLRFMYGGRWKCRAYLLLARLGAWFRRARSERDM